MRMVQAREGKNRNWHSGGGTERCRRQISPATGQHSGERALLQAEREHLREQQAVQRLLASPSPDPAPCFLEKSQGCLFFFYFITFTYIY